MKMSTAAVIAIVVLVPVACADDGPDGTIATQQESTPTVPDATTTDETTTDSTTDSTTADETTADAFDVAAAEVYCTDNGGMLVPRVATWNTNADPPAWLVLAGKMTFCEFDSDDEVPNRISVDLVTLYSEEPTIAALAYLSAITVTLPETPSANPADFSCRADLFGTSTFGNTNTVGGWVNTDEPVFVTMNMCVFPDFSAIDEFGLWYHSNGDIRGIDLAPILRYQPGRRTPAMFEDP